MRRGTEITRLECDRFNFTDPESRIMKAGNGNHFEPSYHAQAAVDVESRLIVLVCLAHNFKRRGEGQP